MAAKQADKSSRTKKQITIAARKLFHEKGYEETTIADIASEAGYAVGTFYRHFKTKTDIAEELYQTISNATARSNQQAMYDRCASIYEALDYILDLFSEPSDENQEITDLYYVLVYSKVNCARPASISIFSESLLHYLEIQLPQAPSTVLKTYADIMIALLNTFWLSSTNAGLMPLDKAIVRDTLYAIAETCIQKNS